MITHSELATLAEWLGGEYRMTCDNPKDCLSEAVGRVNGLKPTRVHEFQLVDSLSSIIENFTISVEERFIAMEKTVDTYIEKHIDALRAETAAAMNITPPSPRRGAPKQRQYKVVLVMKVSAETVEFAINKFVRDHNGAELKAMCDTRDGVLLAFKV